MVIISSNHTSAAQWAVSRIHTLLQLPIQSETIIRINNANQEDSDTWLYIDQSEFDNMLRTEEQSFSEVIAWAIK